MTTPTPAPTQALPATARYLASKHPLPDASAHWSKVHRDILKGKINPSSTGSLAREAHREHQQLLADLKASSAMTSALFTDRVNRCYWLLDAHGHPIDQFPWGGDGRTQAQIAQLQREHPRALTLAQRAEELHPQLNGRALRAAQILADNAIIPNGDGTYTVQSQGRRLPYTVTGTTCSCKDWQNGNEGVSPGAPRIGHQIVCKHILATRIYERINQ